MAKPKLVYCNGCLSVDRRLAPIDDYIHIYIKIMEGEIQSISSVNINIPLMCWECRAMLHNISKFKDRVKTAHNYLTAHRNKMHKTNYLSNLTYSFTNDFIEVIHEDNKNVHEPINDLHTEVDIKREDFHDYDDDINESFDLEPKEEYEIDVKEECDLAVKDEVDFEVLKKELYRNRVKKIQKKKMKAMKAKYKVIMQDKNFEYKEYFKRITIGDNERLYWSELDKSGRNFRTMAYKCHLCITAYATEDYYEQHMKKFHLESSGNFECDMCKKRFPCKTRLKAHIKEHYTKYICTICNFETNKFWKINTHLAFTHKRAVVCLTCGLKFEKRPDFYKHYNNLHTHVTCDYCEKRFKKKQNLIRHIYIRHNQHRCYICQRNYSTRDALNRHNSLHHVVARTEHCYCVECDIQFDNMARYKVHLNTSVKHRAIVGIPCPECNKVYNKRVTMNNHYKYVHLQKTSYYCKKCERYFLNGFRLRQHTASFHDKIRPPKNKLCPHCGRGFQTNRILTNHIRTHTGERPFACELCPSTFTQQTALKVHKRAIHKVK